MSEQWQHVPLMAVADITLGKMLASDPKADDWSEQPYLHAANIRDNGILDIKQSQKSMWFSSEEREKLNVKRDDIFLAEGGSAGKPAQVKVALDGYGFQNSVLRVRANKANVVPRFLLFALLHLYETGEIARRVDTVSIAHFPAEKASRLRVPLPPLDTQRRIADYLDKETAEIDAMVRALDEYAHLIEIRADAHAAAFIDRISVGTPWIQVKFLASITTGSGDTQDAEPNGTYRFYVRSDDVERSSTWSFEGPAVLTSGDGAGVGKIYHLARGKFHAHQRVYVMQNFNGVSPEYFYGMFRTLFAKAVSYGGAKSTVDSVRLNMISDLKIPVPSTSQQAEIVSQLVNNSEDGKVIQTNIEKLRSLLLKRRQVLINDVVTGKKQV